MYRILLVDDDQNIVDGLGSIIKQNFENIFAISSACDGSDALKRLTEDYYHVIISDIRMPKLDGISLLELISKNQIPSVVIMLSGYDDYTYIRNALRLGAYDYLLACEYPEFCVHAQIADPTVKRQFRKAAGRRGKLCAFGNTGGLF